MYRTWKYIISLLIAAGMWQGVQAQSDVPEEPKDTVPFLTGIRLEVDLASALSSLLTTGDSWGYEAAVQVLIKNRYAPVFEMGMGGASSTSLANIDYNGNGMFYRLGVDFNMLKSKPDAKPTRNQLLVGGRLGFTNYKYDLGRIIFSDDYWGGTGARDLNDLRYTALWFEIVAGLRVEIAHNIFMGWSVRMKNLLSKSEAGALQPFHIPGYGIKADSRWGITYSIGYQL